MSEVERFEDTDAWEKARVLTREIHAATSAGNFHAISGCGTRSGALMFRSCRILQKVLSSGGTENSANFWP